MLNRKSERLKMIPLNEMKLENWLSFYTQFSLIKQNWRASTNRSRLWAMRSDLSVSYYHISMPCWDQSLFAFSLQSIYNFFFLLWYAYMREWIEVQKGSCDSCVVYMRVSLICTHKQQCEEACEKNILNNEGGGVENYLWWLTNRKYHHVIYFAWMSRAESRGILNTGHVSIKVDFLLLLWRSIMVQYGQCITQL